ncbi:MAG: prolyl oligopeptidase family serine peptidase [Balneolaceae bacterium]
MRLLHLTVAILMVYLFSGAPQLAAQGTVADYERANELSGMFSGKVTDVIVGGTNWIDDSNRFWYRKRVTDGFRFVRVDPEIPERGPAFDHQRLADTLSEMTGNDYTEITLPFNSFSYEDDESSIEMRFGGNDYTCSLNNYDCESESVSGGGGGGGGGGWGQWDTPTITNPRTRDSRRIESPDGEWEAFIRNYNLVLSSTESDEEHIVTYDGSEGNYYNIGSLEWSPDSQHLVINREIPGYERKIKYVETSPRDQVQPKYLSRTYIKPGDRLDNEFPVLVNIDDKTPIQIDRSLFPNAYNTGRFRWWDDSRAFYFEYNERGHGAFKVIEVDVQTGDARALIDEQEETYFSYTNTLYRHYHDNGDFIIWRSERDGWRHLYLYDGRTGEVINQITEGDWIVSNVDHVDEENEEIWFRGNGMDEDQDPYYTHYYRVNFDGSGLTRFTTENGDHSVSYSPGREYYVDTWSQVDQPPVTQLRRTSDQSLVMELESADHSALVDAGWQAPIQFQSKARDGETDIYGIIIRPSNFDPSKSYPVIEYIYAGPHSNFVPKSFITYSGMMGLAELGFIVVQIDGMGTANRSKAFHDVSWQNLGDAGFPDRIIWHEAVAEQYSWYDNSKVGIYGTSAGGQSSTGALLFHPEHYHVAVSAVGCHDNRMDKIWWNEQWMGWPIGPHYAESSNVDNAHKLEGRLLLIVGELDTNVDPASTYQVADALIRADKDFELLTIPGAGHTSGGSFGDRKRRDFFVQHLMGITPPDWNRIAAEEQREQDYATN